MGRFKSNFATLDTATGVVTSRRADRRFEDLGPVLCDHLNGAQQLHHVASKPSMDAQSNFPAVCWKPRKQQAGPQFL